MTFTYLREQTFFQSARLCKLFEQSLQARMMFTETIKLTNFEKNANKYVYFGYIQSDKSF